MYNWRQIYTYRQQTIRQRLCLGLFTSLTTYPLPNFDVSAICNREKYRDPLADWIRQGSLFVYVPPFWPFALPPIHYANPVSLGHARELNLGISWTGLLVKCLFSVSTGKWIINNYQTTHNKTKQNRNQASYAAMSKLMRLRCYCTVFKRLNAPSPVNAAFDFPLDIYNSRSNPGGRTKKEVNNNLPLTSPTQQDASLRKLRS